MEEKKLEKTVSETDRKEPTYEDLKNYCNQLMMQRNQLAERLSQVTEVLNKLPWLFKVVENSTIFDNLFVGKCAQEIKEILTVPEDIKDGTDKK